MFFTLNQDYIIQIKTIKANVKLVLKDINALVRANTIPMAADPQNMTRKFPTAEKKVSKELLSAYCSAPISRIVLQKLLITKLVCHRVDIL